MEWNSFTLNGDGKTPFGKIDFGSTAASDWISKSTNELKDFRNTFIRSDNIVESFAMGSIQAMIHYMQNGGNGEYYDFKNGTKTYQYSGSQIHPGIYVTRRDAGNYMAGVAARIGLMPEKWSLRFAGAFNAAGNPTLNKDGIQRIVKELTNRFMDGPPYGETPLSHQFQKNGYRNK